jgi:bifunctional non-homologous end joining protein LigD
VTGGRIRAWSRTGRDLTAAYPELGALAAVAGRRILVLDGEIVALSGPRPDFTALQRRMRTGRPGAALLAAIPVTLIIFDVLSSGREDLAGSPYVLRRALLEDLGLEIPGTVQVPQGSPATPRHCWPPPATRVWRGSCSSGPPRCTTPGGAPASG